MPAKKTISMDDMCDLLISDHNYFMQTALIKQSHKGRSHSLIQINKAKYNSYCIILV